MTPFLKPTLCKNRKCFKITRISRVRIQNMPGQMTRSQQFTYVVPAKTQQIAYELIHYPWLRFAVSNSLSLSQVPPCINIVVGCFQSSYIPVVYDLIYRIHVLFNKHKNSRSVSRKQFASAVNVGDQCKLHICSMCCVLYTSQYSLFSKHVVFAKFLLVSYYLKYHAQIYIFTFHYWVTCPFNC